MLRQSKVSTTAQAPKPRISRVKQQLIRQAKDLGAGQELGSLEELSPGTLHDIVYGLKSTSKKPVTKRKLVQVQKKKLVQLIKKKNY